MAYDFTKMVELRNHENDEDIIFDETNHQYFTKEGKELISVTTLLHQYGLAPNYDNVNKTIVEVKADNGKKVHKEIEEWIKHGYSEKKPSKHLENFITYLIVNKLKVVDSEFIVHNEWIAGTVDLLLEDEHGNLVITEIKTTCVYQSEYVSYQLTLYKYLGVKEANKALCLLFDKNGNITTKLPKFKSESQIGEIVYAYSTNQVYHLPSINLDEQTQDSIALAQKKLTQVTTWLAQYKTFLDEMKERLIIEFEKVGAKKFENEDIAITYVGETTTQKFDTTRFKKDYPELYQKYLVNSTKKAYVIITLKDKKEDNGEEDEE